MTMRRQYPKAETMKSVLCEQVRPDLNKKLSFLGVYAGDEIVFHPPTPGALPYRLQGLAFVFMFKDGAGEFRTQFSLMNASGETACEIELESMTMEKGKSAACIVQIGNIEFAAEGVYRAMLTLERKQYPFDFVVSSSNAERSA